jgi:hypothetical protein
MKICCTLVASFCLPHKWEKDEKIMICVGERKKRKKEEWEINLKGNLFMGGNFSRAK